MLFKRFQQLAQWAGFLAIAGLALYGLVTLGSGQLWAAGEESRPAAEDAPAITIPSTFNYQGFLRDGNGNPMGGTHKITLKLWKDVEATNVAALHTEEFPAVAVRDGLFNVLMGSLASLDTDIFVNNAAIFVGISVDDGAELLPRQRIHPVPWAILATSATTATTAITATTLKNNAYVDAATIGTLRAGGDASETRIEIGADTIKAKSPSGGPSTLYVNSGGGEVKFGSNSNPASVDVRGNLLLGGKKPVLIKRFVNHLLYNNPSYLDTGISVNDYQCTVGGRDLDDYNVPDGVNRHTYTTVKRGTTWSVETSVIGQNQAIQLISLDVVCFHWDIVEYQYSDGGAQARQIESAPGTVDTQAAPSEQKKGE